MIRLLFCWVLHLLPRRVLKRWLAHLVSVNGYELDLFGSGRTALFALALHFRSASNARIALVPDYLCNVVPRAINEAGWQIELYSTDEFLEADWSATIARATKGDVGLLVTASVFGSSAMLDRLHDAGVVGELRRCGVRVIVDIAQDISLRTFLPSDANDIVSAIVSFNSKSFPGVMGGGALKSAGIALISKPNPDFYSRLRLYSRLLASIFGGLKRRRKIEIFSRFEYSYCSHYPYKIRDGSNITKLQIVCAIFGIFSLGRYRRSKINPVGDPQVLLTRFSRTAAYLMMSAESPKFASRRRKASYGIEGCAERSLRPDLVIVHNKGFDDE